MKMCNLKVHWDVGLTLKNCGDQSSRASFNVYFQDSQ